MESEFWAENVFFFQILMHVIQNNVGYGGGLQPVLQVRPATI